MKNLFLAFFCCCAFAQTTMAQDANLFDPNKWYRLTTQFQGDGKSLDVINDGKNDKLTLAKTGNFSGQFWKISPLGNGWYRLTTQFQGDGKSLDVINDGKNDKLTLAKTGNFSGQFWKISPLGNGWYRLTTQFQGDGKSLDVINDGKNDKLTLAKTGNFSGQFWKITELPGAGSGTGSNLNVVAYMPPPANNAFSGETVTVSFNAQGVSDVVDSKGNRSLNQQVDGVVTLDIQIDGKIAQKIRVVGPKASAASLPNTPTTVTSAVKTVAFMPPPANNTFSGETVTVSFNAQGVSDVVDSKGNRSLNQQVDGAVTLEIQTGGKKVKTIKIVGPK